MWQTVSGIQRLKNTHGPGWYDTGKPFRDAHHNPGIVGNPRSRYQLRGYLNYNHWPNPFGQLRDINMTICGPQTILDLWFWGNMAGSFWWQNFVPSPRELERKWLTNKYRCGFFLEATPINEEFGPESAIRSPFDILWKDGPHVVIGGIIQPVINGLFYLWVAGTAFNALSQFQTVLVELAACAEDEDSALMALGDADFTGNGGVGGLVAYTIISDPQGVAGALNGDYLMLHDQATYHAYGHVTSFGKFVDSCRIEWSGHLCSNETVELGAISPGETKAWAISGYKTDLGHGDVTIKVTIVQHGVSIAPTFVDCVRFSYTAHDASHQGPPRDRRADPRCWADNMPELAISPI